MRQLAQRHPDLHGQAYRDAKGELQQAYSVHGKGEEAIRLGMADLRDAPP
jgi:hypothetical protein